MLSAIKKHIKTLPYVWGLKIPFVNSFIIKRIFRHSSFGKDKKTNELRVFLSQESDHRYFFLRKIRNSGEYEIHYCIMPTLFFQNIFDYYLERHLHKNPSHPLELYCESKKLADDRKRYFKTISKILFLMNRLFKPDCFLTASIGDARFRYFISVAKKMGIKWFITEREGVIAPIVFEKNPILVAESFKMDFSKMFVSNERHLEYWKKVGVEDYRLSVTGELKSDYWFDRSQVKKSDIHPDLSSQKKMLLYFAFGKNNYIDSRFFDGEGYDWTYLQIEHLKMLFSLLGKYPDLQVVIKGGHPKDIDDNIAMMMKKFIENKQLLILNPHYKAIDLIKVSDIVVGMQTTALIESMFTDKPLIYAGWGELHDSVIEHLLPLPLSGGLVIASSFEDCVEKIEKSLYEPVALSEEQKKARENFRKQYFFCADGSCAKRVVSEIVSCISSV